MKGFRLYDVEKKKLIHSRDVKFNESPDDSKGCKTDSLDVEVEKYEFHGFNDTENVVDNEEPTEDPDLPEDPDNSEDHDQLQELQRSTRERRRPDYYMQQSYVSETPITYKDATISPDKAKWKAAMEAEMKSLWRITVSGLLSIYLLDVRQLEANGCSSKRQVLMVLLNALKQG